MTSAEEKSLSTHSDDLVPPPSQQKKKIVQILASTIVSLVCVAAGAALIAVARRRSAIASAIVISILNQVTPRVCRFINNRFESHSSDGSRQASLYVKMTFFRWTNTVVSALNSNETLLL